MTVKMEIFWSKLNIAQRKKFLKKAGEYNEVKRSKLSQKSWTEISLVTRQKMHELVKEQEKRLCQN